MRFGINLRDDLVKLSDAEIAAKFETLIAERESLYNSLPSLSGNKWLYQAGLGMPLGRGPFRARIFYKISGFLYGSSWKGPSLDHLYVLDCEIKDVRDEMQRRIAERKPTKETSR